MDAATDAALRAIDLTGSEGTDPLSSEFSRYSGGTNFEGWTPVFAMHAPQAFEHSLPGTASVIKVYIGDKNFGGTNTATITAPTHSLEHIIGVPLYALGAPVNSQRAIAYLMQIRGC